MRPAGATGTGSQRQEYHLQINILTWSSGDTSTGHRAVTWSVPLVKYVRPAGAAEGLIAARQILTKPSSAALVLTSLVLRSKDNRRAGPAGTGTDSVCPSQKTLNLLKQNNMSISMFYLQHLCPHESPSVLRCWRVARLHISTAKCCYCIFTKKPSPQQSPCTSVTSTDCKEACGGINMRTYFWQLADSPRSAPAAAVARPGALS